MKKPKITKEKKITQLKSEKKHLYEIEGMKGLYEVKSHDKSSEKYIFKRIK